MTDEKQIIEDLKTELVIVRSYCKAVLETLERPSYELTGLKVHRIKQQMKLAIKGENY